MSEKIFEVAGEKITAKLGKNSKTNAPAVNFSVEVGFLIGSVDLSYDDTAEGKWAAQTVFDNLTLEQAFAVTEGLRGLLRTMLEL